MSRDSAVPIATTIVSDAETLRHTHVNAPAGFAADVGQGGRAVAHAIGSIELQQALPAQVRHERAARAAGQIEHRPIAGRHRLEVRDMERDVSNRAAFDLDIHRRRRRASQRLIDGDGDDRHDQPIAEFIGPPDRIDRGDSPDDDALGAACAFGEGHRCALRRVWTVGPRADRSPRQSSGTGDSRAAETSHVMVASGYVIPWSDRATFQEERQVL